MGTTGFEGLGMCGRSVGSSSALLNFVGRGGGLRPWHWTWAQHWPLLPNLQEESAQVTGSQVTGL